MCKNQDVGTINSLIIQAITAIPSIFEVLQVKACCLPFYTGFIKQNKMEIKRNEATINRPEGDRVIDAPYVFSDLAAFIEQVKNEKAWEKNDRNGITIFKSDNLTMVITALQASAEIIENTVNGFITLHILKGEAQISTPDGDINATENQVITFHPGIPHSVRALSDAIFLITNYSTEEKK
jgi:quercetin dioxygenase-like cupin family protein